MQMPRARKVEGREKEAEKKSVNDHNVRNLSLLKYVLIGNHEMRTRGIYYFSGMRRFPS